MTKVEQQQLRVALFIDELIKEVHPNTISFADRLRQLDVDFNLDLSCSTKTIQRLVSALKSKLKAPIVFNEHEHGYELNDTSWYVENYCSLGLDPEDYL